ncbi:OLC1v1016707C1 [Oldenlandia corymbosa var. corymbosa]|uniref:OLC1v1016707C1 n=1 Tax=Oldenlandia corymbosa var. corymbosa TaxID=529605 RepID=A0AAV1E7T7_OLDCO|nr:OLC1v1016707C1 [Oldenlandia corymbosa var. corymbosa]
MAESHQPDENIETWKMKRLIKELDSARGNGTSMISLIIPPGYQISHASKKLAEEVGKASNIKSRVNRHSVQTALTSAQQRLKLYNRVPTNGLVIYAGTINDKKFIRHLEPFRPINAFHYVCGSKFRTDEMNELLERDEVYGFIVMDGNGTLFGTLSGNSRDILHQFHVELPNKHRRGGQSASRFSHIRDEKRHNYLTKVVELSIKHFISDTTNQCNVRGLILAGTGDFKNELAQAVVFKSRFSSRVLNIVDTAYGGENGFNQAIRLSSELLLNVKFLQEQRLIEKYFDEISRDTGKFVNGVEHTLKALEMGAVEVLIVWEELDCVRYELKISATKDIIVKHLSKDQEANQENFRDPNSGLDLEVMDRTLLLEWLADNYGQFGCSLEFVTNKSTEGSQFVRGFGGIGGILRYPVEVDDFDLDDPTDDEPDEEEEEDEVVYEEDDDSE